MGGSIVRGCFTRPSLSLSRLTTHHSRHSQGAASSPQSASSALNPSHPVSRSFFTSLESKRLGKHIRVRGASHKSCCATHGVNPGGGFVGFVRGRSSFRGSVSFSSVGLSSLNVCRSRRERVVRCSSSAGADPPISAMQASPKVTGPRVSFCPACGGVMEQRIPEGEHELRAICSKCGCIHYQNPKMVVGCLVEHENKVLLCRRNIQPSYGLWTLPAGYMELGESAAEGAARETMEEAQADVEVVGHFAHLDIPVIGQSYIIFRARLKQPNFSPGPESLECALFALDEIPFDSIAFSSISVALKMYIEDVKGNRFRQHHGVIDKRPGASPSDPHGYIVRDHLIV